jgi:endonuclease/exonuclease/phosphatase (EEP) superfamily protein YafD
MLFMPIHLIARLKTRAIYFFRGLTVSIVVLSITGYFGRFNVFLDITSNFKIQYLILGVLLCIFFTLTHQRIWLIVSLACVLINLIEIVPWYIPQGNVASGQPLRLLSLNVLASNQQYDQVIALVEQEKPAIAAFLEANVIWSEKLQVLAESFPYHISAKILEMELYSHFPLENYSIQLYGNNRGNLVSELTIDKKKVTLIVSHTMQPLMFAKDGFKWRNQHLEEGIGDYVAHLKTPVILMGDLNITLWSPYYKKAIDYSGLRNARAGFGLLPTFPAGLPGLSIPIDHCLVSRDISVLNIKTGNYVGSDHLPLITDVIIPDN